MIKVYLDNNIYKLLDKEENSEFKELLKGAKNREIIILFSQAHIHDLHRDKTDKKFYDLKFMDSFVEDNFLVYNREHDTIRNLLVRPEEAYEHYKPSFSSFEEIISSSINELKFDSDYGNIFSSLLGLFDVIPVDLGLGEITEDRYPKNLIGRLGIKKNPMTLLEWIGDFGKVIDNLQNDDSIIKDVRSASKKHLEVQKLGVNIENIDFNEKVSETPLGMSFKELLDSAIKNVPNVEESYWYTQLTTAFMLLNFLGFDSEKNKKVKYLNTQHDSEHFLYSMVSDWVVSNDVGFLNKAKFLINFYGLDIEVMNFKQFQGKLKLLIRSGRLINSKLFSEIVTEFNAGRILSTRLSVNQLQKITVIIPRIMFLDFFNRISFVEMTDGSNDNYIILYKEVKRIYHYFWYKDYERMVNKLVEILGMDDFGYGLYSNDDLAALGSDEWLGREWSFDNIKIRLTRNLESGRMNLIF